MIPSTAAILALVLIGGVAVVAIRRGWQATRTIAAVSLLDHRAARQLADPDDVTEYVLAALEISDWSGAVDTPYGVVTVTRPPGLWLLTIEGKKSGPISLTHGTTTHRTQPELASALRDRLHTRAALLAVERYPQHGLVH